jgi:hypothetical protein
MAEQNGSSCLDSACIEGHMDVVKYLCERGGQELLMFQDMVSDWACCCKTSTNACRHLRTCVHVFKRICQAVWCVHGD